MDVASLPKYVPFERPYFIGFSRPTPRWRSPRAIGVLRDLTWLVAMGVMLYWFQRTATAAERALAPVPRRPALNFKLVAERFRKVDRHAKREEVTKLLGPPTDWGSRFPEVRPYEIELSSESDKERRKQYYRIWYLWRDRKNPKNRVAVLFEDGEVLRTVASPTNPDPTAK